MRFWVAAAADAAAVLLFAAVGRGSHAEAVDVAGTWHTGWPFLAGAAIGTVVGRAWRRPGSLGSGVVVWAGALAGGMTLRVLAGGTTQVSFMIVAGTVLAVLLLGWRTLYAAVQRSRRDRARRAVPSRNA